jgi:hypothetical protein
MNVMTASPPTRLGDEPFQTEMRFSVTVTPSALVRADR